MEHKAVPIHIHIRILVLDEVTTVVSYADKMSYTN